MRILHVTPYYEEAWAYGGIPRIAGALARQQVRRGHQVTVCTTDALEDHGRASPVSRQPGGVMVRTFPNLSNGLAYRRQLFFPRGMNAFLRRRARSFEVAHLHGCHNLPGVLAARHLSASGVPYVLAPNGTALRIEQRRVAKWVFDSTVGRQVVPGAARLLAVTEAERRQFLRLGLEEQRIRVLPNPLDLSEFQKLSLGSLRRELGLDGKKIALYLGRISPRKRLDVLVRAIARSQDPALHLVIAGNDMGYGHRLQQLVLRLGLSDRVTFAGLLRGAQRLEALGDADVVVYAGELEIFGLVPLEALLCGTPVVVADDSGAAEVITHTGGGAIISPGDAAALLEAVTQLLQPDPQRVKEIRRAQARIRETYGAEKVCAGLDRIYQECRGDR